MLTIEELLENLTHQLEALYERPEARTMAEWLLQFLIQVERMELLQKRKEEAPISLQAQVQRYIQRLLQHEPFQYVIGEASFYGRDFHVTPSVLIPRPETEELVGLVIKTYRYKDHVRLLDIGTGSGCIPVTLAAELPKAQVWGLDVSAEALAVAKQNAKQLKQDVTWLHQNILQEVPAIEPNSLDAVISNPPYVLEEEKSLMRQNVLNFEPSIALFVSNEDPLLFYRRIAQVSQQLLKPGGRLFFEINEQFGQETLDLLQQMGYQEGHLLQDMRGKNRMVYAIWK